MNVAELILSSGDAAAPAMRFGSRTVTYAALREQVAAWAAELLGSGLLPGDRVGLFSENSPFFVSAYLGIVWAGLVAVPFPVDCGETAFRQTVASLGIKRLFLSRRFFRRVDRWARDAGVLVWDEARDPPPAAPGPHERPVVDPQRDLAAVMLTSGSTGEPKGVMVTHRNIECNARDIIQYLALTSTDRVMAVLPFAYCYGASLLHTHLMVGGSLVLSNRFMFPEKVLDEMRETRCTGFAGVPSTYQILLRRSHFAQRPFPDLRWLQQAGGRLPNSCIQELRRAFPRVRLFVMYGQTEGTARLSYLPPARLDDKLGSIGRGLPSTRLEVLRADGVPVQPGGGEVGEIVATGDNVALGYWGDAEETRRYFRDDKLYTGDMAQVDAEGFIFLVERGRDFIKPMGNRVAPQEVEDVIAELPQVVETAVIGVPHEVWGEAIKAFVVTVRPGQLTAAVVRSHCLTKLPNHKIPEYVEFLDSLPKSTNGKVAKEKLKLRVTTAGAPMTESSVLEQQIDGLIHGPQYGLPQAEKDALLLPILREVGLRAAARCAPYSHFVERLGSPPATWQSLADIPPLPVTMFKRFLLSAVPAEKVARELRSSATTGQQPSRIVLDKATAFRQTRALVSILKEHIGKERRPLVVLDAPEAAAAGESLGARGAAIRGLASFASETFFAMRTLESGDIEVEWDRFDDFLRAHAGGPALLFGFTFIVWSRFLLEAERRGWRTHLPAAILLHSGGWKRLAADAVSKEEFQRRTAAVLGCPPERVLDYYGMVEQVGTVFVDCEAGHKHAPAFADVLLRRPGTLTPAEPGETGIIEVLSVLPSSYPGHAVITEDQGTLWGVDDCPCGRKGRYFRFAGRIERAEIRGCGDVFAHA